MTSSARMNEHQDGLPPAQATRLHGLIERVPGAIVSRPIARAPGGSVTLLSLDAGQELGEHTAAFDGVILVLEGAVELTIGGACVTARSGEAVRMPAGVPHAVRAAEPLEMLLITVGR